MSPSAFKKWRESLGWSQETAAQHLEIHVKTVSNYERGAATISKVVELATKRLADEHKAAA